MLNYPRNLLIEHRTEKGAEEVKLQLPQAKQERINDLVQRFDNQMTSNVGKNLIAKQRMICQRIDEGYEIVVPARQKWHPSHTRNRDFVHKLNTSSVSLLS